MMNTFLILFSSCFFLTSALAQVSKEELHDITKQNHTVLSYNSARKAMFNKIYMKKDAQGPYVMDVYCNEKHILLAGDVTNDRLPDSTILNTEHTWPQSKFSKLFASSTQKSDLHHLYPTGSKINGQRGNLPFAEVNGTVRLVCNDSRSGNSMGGEKGAYFEPPHDHKGNVARSMFYFSVRYKIAIDKTQEYFLRLWHTEDPVDQAEKLAHEEKVKAQGNRNPFIDNPDLVRQVEDF